MAKSIKKMDSGSLSLLSKLRESESSASIIFGAIVIVVVGILLFNYSSGNRQAQLSLSGESTEIDGASGNSVSLPATYTVVAGDNLWKIAEKFYGSGYNWVDIATANKISENDGLRIGMMLAIPVASTKQQVDAVVSQNSEDQPTSAISTDSYQVVEGDSLWNIAVRSYGDGYKWTSIYQANSQLISNPDMLFVGWTLQLPR